MSPDERAAIEAGYPNLATARLAERRRRLNEAEAAERRRKGELAQLAVQRNQSGVEAASTQFTLPPSFSTERGA